MNKYNNNVFNNLLSFKGICIAAAVIFPVFVILFTTIGGKTDPVASFFVLSVCTVLGLYIFKNSLEKTYLAYLLLQLIIISIFLDNKISIITGINFKLYALVFGLSLSTGVYYLFKYFNYFWKNFIPFRLLFMFFLINIFYLIFYHSDFRMWYSDYLDIWLASPQIRELFISQGINVFDKSFEETKYIGMYLISLVPIVSFTVALLSFDNIDSLDKFKERFCLIVKIILYAFCVYLGLSLLLIIIGVSTISFYQGRLWGDFLGFGQSFAIYLSYYLLFLLGLKYSLKLLLDSERSFYLNLLLNLLILIFFTLVLLQINKTTIIALSLAIVSFIFFNYFFNSSLKLFDIMSFWKRVFNNSIYRKLLFIFSLILMILVASIYSDFLVSFLYDTSFRITSRFSSLNTFDIRTILWNHLLSYWFYNLDIIKLLFGFGIDSSKEAAFYISSMLPYNIRMNNSPLVHVHNLYLEMGFDYGLVSLLFFGSIIFIAFNNAKMIISKAADPCLKVFCVSSLSIIAFFFVFSMTEIMRIPISIILFSLLGFFESAKYYYLKVLRS